jgi:hypothetical protein
MYKFVSSAAAAVTLILAAGAASSASATTFVGDYDVSLHTQSSGFTVNYKPDTSDHNGLNFNLNLGQSKTIDLFTIYTTDTSVQSTSSNPISVDFDFSKPSGAGGSVDGTTQAIVDGFLGWDTHGHVQWNGNDIIALNDGTQLKISLNNADFGDGFLGGLDNDGAKIYATFTLENAPIVGGGGVGAVPEPTSWALMIGGFGMAGGMLRRRRATAAFA